uniref:Carboxypeptidase regulatory-like domain-containing protein n=1 Tax=viral metagenome TaxID=1070528 RepID=A0A6M3LLB1_9ZZZZ
MIIEIGLIVLMIVILIKLLYPELFTPTPPTGIIKGTLKTVDGIAVDEATVVLKQNGETKLVVMSITDGTYEFPAMGLGNYNVTAHKDNEDGSYLEASSDIVLNSTVMVVDLTMVYTRGKKRQLPPIRLCSLISCLINRLRRGLAFA